MLQLVWWCKVQKYRSQGIHGCSPTQCGLLIYNISNTLQWAVRRGSRWSSSFILYEGINQIANQELIAESSSLSCSCWDWSGQSGVTVDSQNHGTCHSTSDPQPRRLELTSVNSHLENTFSRRLRLACGGSCEQKKSPQRQSVPEVMFPAFVSGLIGFYFGLASRKMVTKKKKVET